MARLVPRFGLNRYEADEYYQKALEAYEKKNMEQAILTMQQAIELLPRNAEYHAALGFFYLEDGIMDKAEEEFDLALKYNAYELLANYGKGVLAYRARDWNQAIEFFMTAWATDSNRPETLYYLALAHHHNRDNAKALEWMQRAKAQYEAAGEKSIARDAEKWIDELDKFAERQEKYG